MFKTRPIAHLLTFPANHKGTPEAAPPQLGRTVERTPRIERSAVRQSSQPLVDTVYPSNTSLRWTDFTDYRAKLCLAAPQLGAYSMPTVARSAAMSTWRWRVFGAKYSLVLDEAKTMGAVIPAARSWLAASM